MLRSIFVFLRERTGEAVAAYLDQAYPDQREPWLVTSAGDPRLYIDFHRDWATELERDARDTLVQRFGGEPAVVVMADVSGRHPGDEHAFGVVDDLLTHFSASAQDDYTEHLWSLEELRAGHHVFGFRFFDYNGWHARSKTDV